MTKLISGHSFGFEFEFGSITRGEIRASNELINMGFRDEHDASIETPITLFHGFELSKSPDSISRNLHNGHTGAELVSKVFVTENPLDIFKIVTNWASANGETPENERCGIHFHISLQYDLRTLKNIIRLSSHLEDIFFYVGGMGYKFRGQSNDSIFCRPTTKKGPICIQQGRWERPTFDTNDLLKSQNVDSFWIRYGDSYSLSGMRYTPVRYHWYNLYSLLQQGSLEFRIFNSTLNPHYLWAALELCRAFSTYVMKVPGKVTEALEENSIYNFRNKKDIIKTLRDFSKIVELDDLVLNLLEDIINLTPLISLNNEYVLTHLRTPPTLWSNSEYKTKTIGEKAKKPFFIDIHNYNRRMEVANNNADGVGNDNIVAIPNNNEGLIRNGDNFVVRIQDEGGIRIVREDGERLIEEDN